MHWKKLVNPNYLGAYSLELDGKYVNKVVVIESVAKELVKGHDGKEKECVVIRVKNEKPLISNKTNLKSISKVAGTPDVDKWPGLRIELTVKKVKAFGELVDALRIVEKAPSLPVLNAQHPKWTGAVTALKEGATTIEKIKTKYNLSASDEKSLVEQSKSSNE